MPPSKSLRVPLIVIIGMIVAMVASAGPVNAAPYTIQPVISVSTQTPAIGSSLRVCGRGFHARTRVTLTLDRSIALGSVTSTSAGAFCALVRMPDRVSGSHRLWASDGQGGVASALLRIQGATISLSKRAATVGTTVTVCGQRFHARTRVVLTLDRRTFLGANVTNSRGSFCKSVRLPPRVLGGHVIWANDGHGRVASASIRIVRPGVRVAGVSLSAEEAGGGTTASGTASGSTNGTASGSTSETAGSGALAFTGATIVGIGGFGGLLLLGGGLMLLSGRRRKTLS
jgi:hypothetical protein